MKNIRVRGYLTFRDLIGDQIRPISMEPPSLESLLLELGHELGDEILDRIHDLKVQEANLRIAVLVNGRHYTHLADGLATTLEDGDEIAIFPPMAGG